MSITEIRQQLREYIDVADDKDIATMYSFLEEKKTESHSYSETELKEFYSRRERFINSGSKGYSVEEVHNHIRNRNSSK